jgi:hypothetical protein
MLTLVVCGFLLALQGGGEGVENIFWRRRILHGHREGGQQAAGVAKELLGRGGCLGGSCGRLQPRPLLVGLFPLMAASHQPCNLVVTSHR